MDEKLRMEMLGEVIDGMKTKNRPTQDLDFCYANFIDSDGECIATIPVVEALDYLFNDVYHFEDFDLTDAVKVKVG